jgi:hypothetical protein
MPRHGIDKFIRYRLNKQPSLLLHKGDARPFVDPVFVADFYRDHNLPLGLYRSVLNCQGDYSGAKAQVILWWP